MSGRRLGEQGIALVLTLWLVVLLGAVAAAVVTSTRGTSNLVLNARARTVARYAAESGLVAATATLRTAPAGRMQEIAGLQDVPLGDGRFSVRITNLSARLDLNNSDPDALARLFSQFTSPSAARALAEILQDWRDPDDIARRSGAEAQAYARKGSPFVPSNRPFTRPKEFRRLLGVSASLAAAVEPYLTANGDGTIDVNEAPEAVLAAIPGVGRSGARTLIGRRRDARFTSNEEVRALLTGAISSSLSRIVVAPTRVLLTSQGRMVGHPLIHEIQATYAVAGSRLVLQSWRERDL